MGISRQALCMLFPAFVENLDILIKNWCGEQNDKEQDKIRYIIFQRLRTSGYTGTYEISMGLSNSMLYLDEYMSCVYWKSNLIYENINSDMENVRKKLEQKYIRIEEYELLYLKQRILLDDWKLFFKVLERLSRKLQMTTGSYLHSSQKQNKMNKNMEIQQFVKQVVSNLVKR